MTVPECFFHGLLERAGCSKRLVFERVADFKEMGAAAFEHVLQRRLSTPVGDMPNRDRKYRIAFQVSVRATNCEKWLPLWRVLMTTPLGRLEEYRTKVAVVRQMTRERIELMYAPELATFAPSTR
jgi:hypothetical protein